MWDRIEPLMPVDPVRGRRWADHRRTLEATIINPVNGKEVDADFLLQMKEEPDWANDPQQYSNAVWKALHDHPTYSSMPHGRKCRCVFVKYANSTRVDVVPYVILSVGRKVIINRDDNSFENTDPEGSRRG
jgi:hypothetical protein